MLPVCDCHQLQLPAGHQAGHQIEWAECTIRMNDAPTTGPSADVRTTRPPGSRARVFRGLPRPPELLNQSPDIVWGPQTRCRSPRTAWSASPVRRPGAPAPSRAPSLPPSSRDLTTASGVREARPWGEVRFMAEHRLAHYGDCGGAV